MSKPDVEMEGHCLFCGKRAQWSPFEGWVFHTVARHWRCRVCGCATEPQKFLPPAIFKKLEAQQSVRHLSDADCIEIEI